MSSVGEPGATEFSLATSLLEDWFLLVSVFSLFSTEGAEDALLTLSFLRNNVMNKYEQNILQILVSLIEKNKFNPYIILILKILSTKGVIWKI